jgi:transposase-like protein
MLDKAVNAVARLRQRGELRDDLNTILSTPEGKRFFKVLLKECHVTKPVFHSDNNKLRESEGRRRLAMSFLSLMGQDDPHQLINIIEQENHD